MQLGDLYYVRIERERERVSWLMRSSSSGTSFPSKSKVDSDVVGSRPTKCITYQKINFLEIIKVIYYHAQFNNLLIDLY